MFYNNDLLKALSSSIKLLDHDMLADDQFIAMVNQIFESDLNIDHNGNYKRDRNLVEKNTLQGKMCEIACHELCDIPYVWNNFNVKYRKSYAVDMEAFSLKCEIKSIKPRDRVFYIPNRAYKTLFNNIKTKSIDTIIVCNYENNDHEWQITPRLVINPKTIESYISPSKYGLQYEIETAIKRKDAISLI